MQLIALPILIVELFFLSCMDGQKIDVLEIKDYGQFFNPEKNKVFSIGSPNRLVSRGQQRMYITLNVYLTLENVLDDKGKKIDERIIKADTTYDAYVYELGQKNGLSYKYEHFKEQTGKPFAVDWLMTDIGLDESNMRVFSMELGQPKSTVLKASSLIEKYVFPKKRESDPDSVVRYYDKNLKHVEFSFSRKLDSAHNSKLV